MFLPWVSYLGYYSCLSDLGIVTFCESSIWRARGSPACARSLRVTFVPALRKGDIVVCGDESGVVGVSQR